MVNPHNYAVIMAGGIGSRFWPMSRASFPKQFHDILGTGRTLIKMTFDRLAKMTPEENIFVVTNERYRDLVLEQLPGMKADQVLCEPFMRNTAPCIAYANFRIAQRDPKARIVVAPSDHLITDESGFIETLELAIKETSTSKNLVTLGIKPHRPDTGYGYIQFDEDQGTDSDRVMNVKTFTEKPNLELAQSFLDSGDFYWNSGIFIWSLENIQQSFQDHLPEMYELFLSKNDAFGGNDETTAIEQIYGSCENISIDYGIMEKAQNVKVVLSDFGWSDLGTWGSLCTHLDQDDQGNGIVGDCMAYQAVNNVVYGQPNKLVVLQGLNDFIVVDTKDALLICKKSDEQKIKSIVNDLKTSKEENYV
ncbi:MAG: NTP transferase domain-containing protein [Flavobacteriales bacterium]|nr:NTP transferase domain-containing protein [Flavobacteriales bacterium]